MQSLPLSIGLALATMGVGFHRNRMRDRRRRTAAEADLTPMIAFEPGRTALAPEVVDAAVVVREVLAALDREVARRFIRLVVAVPDTLPMRADPRALRRTLARLVQGGLDLAPGGTVLIAASRQGDHVRIAVADDGEAIETTALSAGLGLLEELAVLQGGSVQAESRPGLGTTLVLRLPGAIVAKTPAAELASASLATASAPDGPAKPWDDTIRRSMAAFGRLVQEGTPIKPEAKPSEAKAETHS